MDRVQGTHETIIITKRGMPVAKLVPIEPNKDEIYNFLAGKGSISGNIVLPVISLDEWGSLQ